MNIHSQAIPQAHAHFRPKPDGATDPAGEAGWYLQRERENLGIPLDKAGQDTGIHPHHLEAIEMGNLEGLPERSQALRMIGSYARYLGFDPKPLVAHYGRLMPRDNKAGELAARAFSSARIISFPLVERLRSATSGAGGVVASLLAGMILFGGAVWALMPAGDDDGKAVEVAASGETAAPGKQSGEGTEGVRTVASISRVAEERLTDDGKPGVGSMAELIERTVLQKEKAAPLKAAAAKKPDVNGKTATRPLPNSVKKTAAAPSTARDGAAKGAPGKGLVLRASADIWVRIEDEEGNTLYSGLMKAGDTYTVPDKKGLSIIARDGSLLEWLIGGKVMGKLAAPGEVLVGEPLDPRALARRKG